MTSATHFNGSPSTVDSAHVSAKPVASSSDPAVVSSDENQVVIDVRDGVEPSASSTSANTSSGSCGLLPTSEGDAAEDTPSGAVDANQTWSIAQLASEFKVTHRTLRYYESLGLVNPNRVGSRRVFSNKDRVRLSLVLRGKRLGFGLDEIAEIVNMYAEGAGAVGQLEYVLSRLGERRIDLERRLSETQAALDELDALQRGCATKLAQAKAGETN